MISHTEEKSVVSFLSLLFGSSGEEGEQFVKANIVDSFIRSHKEYTIIHTRLASVADKNLFPLTSRIVDQQ